MAMNSFVLYGAIFGGSLLANNEVLCEISAIVCMISCFGSLWTMMFVAINRYMFICKTELYRRVFDVKGTIFTIVLIWICVLLLDIVNYPFIPIGGHAFFAPQLHCSFVLGDLWFFNTILYTGVALGLPLIVTPICYWKLWSKASESKLAKSEKRKREQRQLMISLVTIFVTFVITWAPLGAAIFMVGIDAKYFSMIPEGLYVMMELLAHSNSAINFIIYGVTHRGMREAYKKILPCCKIFKGNNQISSGAAASQTSSRK
ncbi:melatonin receptor type 1B-B-like [Convolutriloba macropyga]|uniref:melatonin receptor type 1B-B-like n=1 Tax=Convolutriloba macropyga TaxID=536237 RepID=UPI003F52150E